MARRLPPALALIAREIVISTGCAHVVLVADPGPPCGGLHTHPCNAGDLTIYQITLFVNLSARIMVKFRPFLRLSSEGGTEDAPEHRARPLPVFLAAPASLRQ